MPIYEYECEGCEQVFEFRQKFSDDPIATCEQCGGPLKKLISRSSFHLKGSGWYQSDYKNKKPPTAAKTDTPEKAEKPEKAQETKAAPTPDPKPKA